MKILIFLQILLFSISISGQSDYESGFQFIPKMYLSSDSHDLKKSNNFWIDLATSWTYEAREIFGDRITTINYMVVDTMTIKGKKCFKIDDDQGITDVNVLFSYENGKGYIYDTINDKFNLFIDYTSTDSFNFTTMSDDGFYNSINGIALVDSIRIFTMPDGSDSYFHYITYKATIDGIETKHMRKALRNIGFIDGNSFGGWELGLCYNPIYEPELLATKLRCFTNDSVNYNFVGYACDSTWVKSNVSVLESESLIIFPNPTNNFVHLDFLQSEIIQWKLYSYTGNYLQSGLSSDIDLSDKTEGLYLLEIFLKDKTMKLVKLVKIRY